MLIIDLRNSRFTPDNVPEDAWVPIATAHTIVGAGRTTVYRWYAQDRIQGVEIAEGFGAETIHVQVRQVREHYQRTHAKRHAVRRVAPK
jgi:hypothetical protein